MTDMVNRPSHCTQGGIEANIIKYLWGYEGKM